MSRVTVNHVTLPSIFLTSPPNWSPGQPFCFLRKPVFPRIYKACGAEVVCSETVMLLRKVWESVSTRKCSTSKSSTRPIFMDSSSLGVFDRLPSDILIQILKLIGPKEAAKLSCVCKSWGLLVSDNRLWIYFLQHQQEPWESIFFGETTLISGYPFQWVFLSWRTCLVAERVDESLEKMLIFLKFEWWVEMVYWLTEWFWLDNVRKTEFERNGF